MKDPKLFFFVDNAIKIAEIIKFKVSSKALFKTSK
jgi:hypothetical protein